MTTDPDRSMKAAAQVPAQAVDPAVQAWYERQTSSSADWPLERVLELKGDQTITVVIPARNEEATVADVVSQIRRELVDEVGLIDELVVMDSLSTDATADRARQAGAQVHDVTEIVPELGVRKGKGEALWKSLFVTSGDIVLFIDADLTEWGTHFVTALAGPLLADDRIQLVKGFYDRVLDMGEGVSTEGGRVTELVARPLLALHWPALAGVVQPLAGEWAIRRSAAERLPFPVGYGVETSTLLDVARHYGAGAVAQVDLGRRAHKHQNLHDLGVMAAEILAVAGRRLGLESGPDGLTLARLGLDRTWEAREVPTAERPPAVEVASYRARGAA